MGTIGTLFGGGAMKRGDETSFFLARLDMDADELEPKSTDVAFLAHWVEPNPNDPRQAVLFEKHGPGCCLVDLESCELLETITTTPQRQFYGHGAFSADGSLLYATETDITDNNRGHVVVRDAHDFHILGTFPSFGLAPHDSVMIDEGRTMVISNGGSAVGMPEGPSVTYIDVETQKLLERVDIPAAHINAGHLAITSAGDLVVVSAPREGIPEPAKHPGGLSIRPAGGEIRTMSEPEDVTAKMLGETLSVAVHEPTGTVAATNPEGHLITFWRLKDGSFIKSLRVPLPRGVALSLDGDELIISFGKSGKISRLSAETLTPVDVPGNRDGVQAGATGSHIRMYALPG